MGISVVRERRPNRQEEKKEVSQTKHQRVATRQKPSPKLKKNRANLTSNVQSVAGLNLVRGATKMVQIGFFFFFF